MTLSSNSNLVWATYNDTEGHGGFKVSEIGTLFGRPYPQAPRPRAKQLKDGEGLVLNFFFQWPESDTPHSVTVVDLLCDPGRSGLELLERYGYNPGWVGNEDENEESCRNNARDQTPSLRFLNWTKDN